jgi:hypothetical protein
MPKYGNMEYLSGKAKLENNRPESKYKWCYDVVDQLCETVEREGGSKGNDHGLVAYNTHRGRGWNITIGADRGKGAWRCHTKINAHSPAFQRRYQNQTKFENEQLKESTDVGWSKLHILRARRITRL